MRIISKYRDYYDVGMRYGQDLEVLYVRGYRVESGNEAYELLKVLRDTPNFPRTVEPYIRFFVVSVCGKAYIGLRVHKEEDPYHGIPSINSYAYDFEAAEKLLQKAFSEKELEWYYEDYKSFHHRFFRNWKATRQRMKEVFERYHCYSIGDEIHRRFKSPILSIGLKDLKKPEKVEINRSLKECEFFRVKDPSTMYQEIYQYISGVLGIGEIDTVDISDTKMAEKKGYDNMSFRRRPGTKKRRKDQ